MFERRSSPRLRLTRKIGIIQSNGEVIYAWTHDLSVGGLQIRTEYSADVGAEFNAFMGIFDARAGRHVTLEFRVQVRHLLYDGTFGCFRVGMRIVEFFRDGEETYERFLEDKLASPFAHQE